MPGSMSQQDLVEDLKASLFDSAKVFEEDNDDAFKRFLQQALPDMEVKRPITRLGSVTLVADQARFAIAEADFASWKVDLWRDPTKLPRPWETTYPGPLPRMCAERDGSTWYVAFDPPPTAAHIAVLGSACRFWYFAHHAIGAEANQTTIAVEDRGLLLLRAQAEALLALAIRNAGKPVSMRDGISGVASNSTPAALYEQLLKRFAEMR